MGDSQRGLVVECNYQDVMPCAHCGDDIEEGEEKVCWEPEPLMGEGAIVPVHPWCAVKDGYRLIYERVCRCGDHLAPDEAGDRCGTCAASGSTSDRGDS